MEPSLYSDEIPLNGERSFNTGDEAQRFADSLPPATVTVVVWRHSCASEPVCPLGEIHDAAQDGGPLAAAAGYRSPEDEPSATWCAMRPAIPLWHRPQARRPRAPWALTLLLLVGLLCWCVGDRVARGSGPNTGAGSASLSTQGGARTKDPPPPPPPPPPQSEGIDEPRVHRVLQPPADREPPLGQDPARTLPGSLRALATWMGAVSLLALFMAGCAAAAGALGILLWQRRRRNEITLGGGE